MQLTKAVFKGSIPSQIFMNKPEKVKIQPVQKVICPNKGCGELMLKIYPWSSYKMPANAVINPCVKCMNKITK